MFNMKNLKFALYALVSASFLIFSTSCETDPPVDPNAPEISLNDNGGVYPTSDFEFCTDGSGEDVIQLLVSGLKNTNDMFSLEVSLDNSFLSESSILSIEEFGGGAINVENPLLLTDPETFTYIYTIAVPTEVGQERTISFRVLDVNNLSSTTSISFTALGCLDEITGALLNSAGPTNTGGLDLDTGTGTGSGDAAAEIADNGVDNTIDPSQAENWSQSFYGTNGTIIRKMSAGDFGDYNFSDVISTNQIESYFANGDAITEEVNGISNSTGAVSVGDVYLAKNGDDYYLLEVTGVIVVSGSNSDQIEFSIKKKA